MRLFINIFALVGVLAVISVGLMVKGFLPDGWWRQQKTREITSIQMGSEVRSPTDVIIGVCNQDEDWSYRTRMEMVRDIRQDGVQYFLKCPDDKGLAQIEVRYYADSNKWFIRAKQGSPCKLSDPSIPKNCTPSDD